MLCAKPCFIGCKRSCSGSKANVDDDFEKDNSMNGALNASSSLKDDDFVSADLSNNQKNNVNGGALLRADQDSFDLRSNILASHTSHGDHDKLPMMELVIH